MSPGMMTPTPAASPSANLGAQASAAGKVKQALILLETALPMLELSSPLHGAVRQSINGLAKHLPAASGQQDRGLQESMLRDLALRQQQQSPLIAAMQQRGAGAPGGAPPSPSPGAPPG